MHMLIMLLLIRAFHIPFDSPDNGTDMRRGRRISMTTVEHYVPNASLSSLPTTAVVNNDHCEVCRETGEFVCCETCPRSFHFYCAEPPCTPEEVEQMDHWFCKLCRLKHVGCGDCTLLQIIYCYCLV